MSSEFESMKWQLLLVLLTINLVASLMSVEGGANTEAKMRVIEPGPYKNQVGNRLGLTDREIRCLARNIFFEAGVESYDGMIAVAQVTHTRLESGRWGDDLCDVVYARAQFSWTLVKKRAPPRGPLWAKSKRAAQDFVNGARLPELEGVMHYHADYANPAAVDWAGEEYLVATIGKHLFYNGARQR